MWPIGGIDERYVNGPTNWELMGKDHLEWAGMEGKLDCEFL